MTMMAIIASPPTTPPTMAPMLILSSDPPSSSFPPEISVADCVVGLLEGDGSMLTVPSIRDKGFIEIYSSTIGLVNVG